MLGSSFSLQWVSKISLWVVIDARCTCSRSGNLSYFSSVSVICFFLNFLFLCPRFYFYNSKRVVVSFNSNKDKHGSTRLQPCYFQYNKVVPFDMKMSVQYSVVTSNSEWGFGRMLLLEWTCFSFGLTKRQLLWVILSPPSEKGRWDRRTVRCDETKKKSKSRREYANDSTDREAKPARTVPWPSARTADPYYTNIQFRV